MKRLKKIHAFKTGGIIGELQQIAKMNGDDSLQINTWKKGESVFDVSTTEQLIKFNQNADKFANLMSFATSEKTPTQTVIYQSFDGLTIELPGVTDFAQFKNELMNDGDFRKFIFQVTDSNYSGTSKLSYKKFIK